MVVTEAGREVRGRREGSDLRVGGEGFIPSRLLTELKNESRSHLQSLLKVSRERPGYTRSSCQGCCVADRNRHN